MVLAAYSMQDKGQCKPLSTILVYITSTTAINLLRPTTVIQYRSTHFLTSSLLSFELLYRTLLTGRYKCNNKNIFPEITINEITKRLTYCCWNVTLLSCITSIKWKNKLRISSVFSSLGKIYVLLKLGISESEATLLPRVADGGRGWVRRRATV